MVNITDKIKELVPPPLLRLEPNRKSRIEEEMARTQSGISLVSSRSLSLINYRK